MQTTAQRELFDGERLRDDGLARATRAPARRNLLDSARATARMLARRKGDVTSDDVVAHYADRNIDLPAILGNAMGSLFRTGDFRATGRFRQSTRPSRHAAWVRVWEVDRDRS